MAHTRVPRDTPQSTVLRILHRSKPTLSPVGCFLGASEYAWGCWLEGGSRVLQCSPQPGTSTGQEGAEEVASEGVVLAVCSCQAQRWPSPLGRRPSGLSGSQMCKIPWKRDAIVKGMSASPWSSFSWLTSAWRDSVRGLTQPCHPKTVWSKMVLL